MTNEEMDLIILKTALSLPAKTLRISPDLEKYLDGVNFVVDGNLPQGSMIRAIDHTEVTNDSQE